MKSFPPRVASNRAIPSPPNQATSGAPVRLISVNAKTEAPLTLYLMLVTVAIPLRRGPPLPNPEPSITIEAKPASTNPLMTTLLSVNTDPPLSERKPDNIEREMLFPRTRRAIWILPYSQRGVNTLPLGSAVVTLASIKIGTTRLTSPLITCPPIGSVWASPGRMKRGPHRIRRRPKYIAYRHISGPGPIRSLTYDRIEVKPNSIGAPQSLQDKSDNPTNCPRQDRERRAGPRLGPSGLSPSAALVPPSLSCPAYSPTPRLGAGDRIGLRKQRRHAPPLPTFGRFRLRRQEKARQAAGSLEPEEAIELQRRRKLPL